MLKFRLLIAMLLAVVTIQAQGIEFFHGTWDEALVKAKEEQKIIFVDCFTTWCGPCKKMAATTFKDAEVGEFFNKNFINMKLDMEQAEGKKFGQKYAVSAYPTLYFINDKGEVVKKVVGGQKVNTLIEAGKKAKMSDDRSGDYAAAYEEGDRDYSLVFNYVKSLNNVGKPSLKIANDYLNSNPEITEKQRLRFLFESAVESDSKIFEMMVDQKVAIIDLVGEEKYNEKVKGACKATVKKAIEFEMDDLMTEAINKAEMSMTDGAESFQYESKMEYYSAFNEKDKYLKAAYTLAQKEGKSDPRILKNIIEDICQDHKDDKKAMKNALKYSKKVYEDDSSFDNLAIYVRTLLVAEKSKDALKLANKFVSDPANEKKKRQAEGLIKYIESQIQKEG